MTHAHGWVRRLPDSSAPLITMLRQLAQAEHLPAAALRELQCQQLAAVAGHAATHSVFFRDRLAAAGLTAGNLANPQNLQRLPLLTRRDLQDADARFFCGALPPEHQPVNTTSTSGSSGEPVVVRRTAQNQRMWMANTLRDHLWQQRDFSGTLAVIRATTAQTSADAPSWGAPVSWLFQSGSSHLMPLNTDIRVQANWLRQINPHYLLTYPTNLEALLDEFACAAHASPLPQLKQIRTIGETLTPALTQRVEHALGIGVADLYSSQEAGIIALQCPQSGLYHLMAESLLVEIIDQRGQACAEGETGRVVITDLLNYATPLFRYDIGDYAEVGPAACPCGRGLPTLRRIVGRRRNMLRHPGGQRYWPLVGFDRYRDIAPIRQYQLIQTALETIEVRLVSDAPLSSVQEQQLGRVINEALGYPFRLQFVYFEHAIPRGAGGKFEEFICAVA